MDEVGSIIPPGCINAAVGRPNPPCLSNADDIAVGSCCNTPPPGCVSEDGPIRLDVPAISELLPRRLFVAPPPLVDATFSLMERFFVSDRG